MFANAIRNLNAALKSAGGATITYRRGNDSIDITAVPVRVNHSDYSPDADLSLTSRDRDWIVLAEDLAIAGQLIDPQRGDEIDWIDSLDVTHTYEVLPRAGDRCFRHTDVTMLQFRIYTKEAPPNDE